ncbi:MAG: hypothetical protein ACQGVC_16785 [Myxococcota bacterium]
MHRPTARLPALPLLAALLSGCLAGCAGLPAPRDTVGVSHLLPLADPMGPDETALGLCVGTLSERGALLKSCDDLAFLQRDDHPPLSSHPAPEYRREIVDSSIGSRNAYLQLGARYAWSVERVVTASRRIAWRDEEAITDEQSLAIADACRGAARGGHIVVAEYHGCGVVVSSGDLSVTPPTSLEDVFHAKIARGEFETRGVPQGFLLLDDAVGETFDPAAARCGDSATLLVKTRSLADLCLERVPGIVRRKADRERDALFARIGSLELSNGELRAMLDGCRERSYELARRVDAERLARAELLAAGHDAERRLAALTATHEAARREAQETEQELAACTAGAELAGTPAPAVAAEPPPEPDVEAVGG